MRAYVTRCDVCGAEESKENPVDICVTEPAKKKPRDEYITFGIFATSEPTHKNIDMCRECGLGMLSLIRESQRRRKAAEREKKEPKPASVDLSSFVIKFDVPDIK